MMSFAPTKSYDSSNIAETILWVVLEDLIRMCQDPSAWWANLDTNYYLYMFDCIGKTFGGWWWHQLHYVHVIRLVFSHRVSNLDKYFNNIAILMTIEIYFVLLGGFMKPKAPITTEFNLAREEETSGVAFRLTIPPKKSTMRIQSSQL